jgi:hypothetical protein
MRDVEDLQLRMRMAENLDTPMSRALAQQAQKLQEQVSQMDVHGTQITQVRLKNIEDDIQEVKADVKTLVASKANVADFENMRKAQAQARAAVRAALIAAALSLCGSLILFAVTQAATK